jgi:hypothetical protein
MFRKLVANLSFSPALIHQVGFYASRLRKEETTRQLTIIFTVLALVVQSLAVFSPPESANASSEQDLIRGGVSDKNDLLTRYKANESNIKDIYTAAGITQTEIENATPGTVQSKDSVLVMGRFAQFGSDQGEVTFSYTKSDDGQIGTAYMAPLHLWDTSDAAKNHGTTYDAWIGQSAKVGWFAILKNCANLATKALPAGATNANSPIKQTITAINLTQGSIAADTVTAEGSDRISYTITAENSGDTPQLVPLAVPLADILEYSQLTDNGGAALDDQTKLLTWAPVKLAPHESQQRTFVVQLLDPIPATATGQSNTTSYDCVLSGSFGTSVSIRADCPPAKTVEAATSLLPTLGIFGNTIFAFTIGVVITFFYLRTRQLRKEIRIIRHDLNAGTL